MNDPRWALAQRIIASSHLNSSPKLCDFFLYVVDCCLRNAPEEATEQQIGVHVFHRIPGYNSSDDSIVRASPFTRTRIRPDAVTDARSARKRLPAGGAPPGRTPVYCATPITS